MSSGLPGELSPGTLTAVRLDQRLRDQHARQFELALKQFQAAQAQILQAPPSQGGRPDITDYMTRLAQLQTLVTQLQAAAAKLAKVELEAHAEHLKVEQMPTAEQQAWLQQRADDSQLATLDLTDQAARQQQVMQMMSNVSKSLHDTAMSVIRKIGT
jgi:hypothetical protein